MLEKNDCDLVALQAMNAHHSERLVEAEATSVLNSKLLDAERSLLQDKADAVTAQQAAADKGG